MINRRSELPNNTSLTSTLVLKTPHWAACREKQNKYNLPQSGSTAPDWHVEPRPPNAAATSTIGMQACRSPWSSRADQRAMVSHRHSMRMGRAEHCRRYYTGRHHHPALIGGGGSRHAYPRIDIGGIVSMNSIGGGLTFRIFIARTGCRP